LVVWKIVAFGVAVGVLRGVAAAACFVVDGSPVPALTPAAAVPRVSAAAAALGLQARLPALVAREGACVAARSVAVS
jgi:hypothetical protein